MYTVTCSACGHAEKSLFARIGAVMVCASCKAKVPLRAEDVKRQFKLRIDAEDELFRVPQVERAADEPMTVSAADVVSTAEAGPAVHAAAAQELHEDHAALALEAEAARRRKPKSAQFIKPGTPGESAQQLAARKRQTQTIAIFAGVGAVVITVIIIIIAGGKGNGADGTKDIASKDGTPTVDGSTKDGTAIVPNPGKDGDKDGTLVSKDGTTPTPPDPTKDKTPVPPPMVRVAAVPLGIDQWQTVNEPYRAPPIEGGVLLINETSEKQENGQQTFKAQVVSQGVASVLVSVALVNDEDRVYAKFERPYFLLDGKKPRPLQLVIPKELVGSGTAVCWSVFPIDAHVKNATLLEDTLAEVVTGEAKPVVKLSAYNPTDRLLKDAAFVIQALDAAGQITSQWRLKFPHEVGAKSWVKFEAELPETNLKAVANWGVLGAGIPSGEAVVPPPAPDPGERVPFVIPRKGLFDF